MLLRSFAVAIVVCAFGACTKCPPDTSKEPILLDCSQDIPEHLIDNPALEVDYIVQTGCRADATMPDNMIIDPGVTIVFRDGAGFVAQKSITAKGTAAKPITFRGENNNVKGAWYGIFVTDYAEGVFEHCVFEGAGGNPVERYALQYGSSSSNVALFAPNSQKSISVAHCKFNNIAGAAFRTTNKWNRILAFNNNTFDNIDSFPIEVQPIQVGMLGSGNQYGVNIGKKEIHVYQNEFQFPMDNLLNVNLPNEWGNQSIRWTAQGIGYFFDSIVVSFDEPLTIEAGVKMRAPVASIIFNNRLTAIGTQAMPIAYSGQSLIATAPPGGNNEMAFWTIDGAPITGGLSSRNNAAILYLGWTAHYFTGARLPGELNLHDCTFSNSIGYGFNHLNDAVVTMNNNTYVNMTLGGVIVE
jgi:hypothetical protein